MIQVTPYGFCFLCDKPYECGATTHYDEVHKDRDLTKLPPWPENYLFTPNYLAWKREHENQNMQDIRSVLHMLEGNTPKDKIINFIRAYILEEIPKDL